MEISLNTGGRRLAALLICTLLMVTVGFTAARMLVSDRLDHSKKPERWLYAAKIDPGNGDYWHHLGEFRQQDFDNADLDLAQEYYRKAVQADPRSSRYWMDLGSAYEEAGKTDAARAAYQQAVAAYPLSADVKWNYGNFLLRAGAVAEGFAVIHQATVIDPKLTALAISRCWHSDPNVERLLRDVVPPNTDAYISAIDFFASAHDVDSGLQVWNRLIQLRQRFPLKATFGLIDEMIQQLRMEDAGRVWRQAYQVNGLAYDEPAGHSVVWNGGFEREIAGGGLDWRKYTVFGVNVSSDTTVFHSGARSMRLDFIGATNPDFAHLFEWLAVEPDTKYHFHAFVRSQEITTESGVRFYLADPHSGSGVQLLTPSITGTTPWTAVDADIVTGPDSRVLLLQVRRLPSRLFDNRASGIAWLDDISLTRAGEAAQPAIP
jgi:tetratricopeptide (TPR) repeat protein